MRKLKVIATLFGLLFSSFTLASPNSDILLLKSMVLKWNQTNSFKDINSLSSLYGESLIYYGSKYKKSMCLKDKKRIFAKYPNFSQKIDNLSIKELSDRVYKISFVKYVKTENLGQAKIYPSYLIIKFYGNNPLIIEEGDKVTDANLVKRYLKNKSEQQNTSGIALNINGTQVNAKKILKNCETSNDIERKFCRCSINFSNSKIKPISLGECVNVEIKNQSDLNDDGSDEIGVLADDKENGCWRDYQIYSINKMNLLKKVFTMSVYTCSFNSINKIDLVKKNPTREGYVLYRYFGMDKNNNIDFGGTKWVSGKLK